MHPTTPDAAGGPDLKWPTDGCDDQRARTVTSRFQEDGPLSPHRFEPEHLGFGNATKRLSVKLILFLLLFPLIPAVLLAITGHQGIRAIIVQTSLNTPIPRLAERKFNSLV
jgi:hypothetical protein